MFINRKRVHFIDEYRGFVIILMVLYHLIFDLVNVYGMNVPFYDTIYRNWLVYFIGGSFILISGISCSFSKNNLKRGLICFAISLLLTLVTSYFTPQFAIKFGILHFMGIAIIIAGLTEKIRQKIPMSIGIILNLFLFLFTFDISLGYLGIPNFIQINLPHFLYEVDYLFPIGIYSSTFFSGDYYPLIPWLFLFMIGTNIGKYSQKYRVSDFFYKNHSKVLSLIGKHSMIIYLLHQPLIYLILMIIM